MIRRAASYVLAGAVLAWLLVGCGASRNTKLATTLAGLNGARDTWLKYDAQHELDLQDQAPDMPTFTKQFDAYHAQRVKVDAAFTAAYNALDDAVKSSGALDLVEKEAANVYTLLKQIGVLK